MKQSKVFLDFEYRNVSDADLDLVCGSYLVEDTEEKDTVWLQSPAIRDEFAHKMFELSKTYVFCAFVVQAEARCLFQLWDEAGIEYDISKLRFVDLYIEYRMLTNHNHKMSYGDQYIKGKVVYTTPPPNKYGVSEFTEDTDVHHKPEHSLAAAAFKLIRVTLDTEHKDKMRDLIISGVAISPSDAKAIMEYCESDVKYLPKMYKSIANELIYKLRAVPAQYQTLREEMYVRGEFAARTAKMEVLGYPVNIESLKKFVEDVPNILAREAVEINVAYPKVQPFEFDKRQKKYVLKQDRQRKWIKSQKLDADWLLTDKGFISLSLEAYRKKFNSSSEGFGGAMVRYLYMKQSLNGFMPQAEDSKRKKFWDFVGSDGRVRPWYGIYGAQSARSQPGATGFIPLKSNWMRAFIQPPRGRAIVGIDYASQEFLISGLISEDTNMIKAYHSGDPYLYFAKLDGAIPPHGTKDTHKNERAIYKTVTLGISYNMAAKGLSVRLTNELGRPYTEDEAQGLIDSFNNAFSDFADWKRNTLRDYKMEHSNFANIKLPCGWRMWGDNDNWRSIGNVPIQGFGSSIMRKAVAFAQDRGLDVIYTLHDALYVEYDFEDYAAIDTLYESMEDAFKFYFRRHLHEKARCRLDAFTWSNDYSNATELNSATQKGRKFSYNQKYIDDKGVKDYIKYQTYF